MQINPLKLAHAVETAKSKTTDRYWLAAIDRASACLRSGWIYTEHTDHILITTDGGTYTVNGVCNCKAAQNGDSKCKHRAAKRLIEMMETAPAAVSPRAAIIERIKTAFAQRYSGSNLKYNWQDAICARFRTYDTDLIALDALENFARAFGA
jgi:hypothetical protein